MDNSNIISDSFCSSLSQFTFESTFPYPKFVHWTMQNYVPSTRQILSADGSRVIITLYSETLRKTLCLLPMNPSAVHFSEEESLIIINALDSDQLSMFMSKMFKPDISPSKFSFLYDISLFNQTLQAIFSLLSQILGLQDDKLVTEIMVGTVCLVSQSTKKFSLIFDQYLVEKISYQLGHLNSDGKVFNYQTLLMLMVIIENLDVLKKIEPINFSDSTNLSQRNATIYFFIFAGSVMPALHNLIFGSFMQRISEDLKLLLQNPVETIGDWFCFENYTVIRVYGFEGEPIRLPRFTSRRLFSLEYLRQRLVAENDNFIKHKKSSSMKFVFTLEPFVVKSIFSTNAID